jgi:glycosyltransferase involved in cell wall biosynthesis
VSARILVAHNAYQQRGGEDSVVDAELALLRMHGHEVLEYTRHNDEVQGMSRVKLAIQTLWSGKTVEDVTELLRAHRPDVIHVHNTFPLISPSLYWAAARMKVPVVQTLHNFRLHCPQAIYLRDDRICEDCKGRVPWRGVMHKCYRGSASQTGVLTASVMLHRSLNTYRDKVARYIALNEFCRSKLIEGGLPAERIRVKPNFIDASDMQNAFCRDGGLYVGRLSNEKGLDVLVKAVGLLGRNPVRLIGGGDLENVVKSVFGDAYLGYQPLSTITQEMRRSSYLVLPSICYEGFPRTIVEAFSAGLPVIASRLGSLPEIVEEGRTGLLFEPGSARDLANKISWAEAHPQEMGRMGEAAYEEHSRKYTSQKNYEILMEIYDEAICERI